MILSLLKLNIACFYCSREERDVDGEIEDLVAYFEHQLTLENSFPKICTPELERSQMHISGKKKLKTKKIPSVIFLHYKSHNHLVLFIPNVYFSDLTAALPREILMYIFRWVVSSDLDMRALEQLSLVCRGFYMCARSAPLP